jgi:hypothetical protein
MFEPRRADIAVLMGDLNEWLLWGRPLPWLRRHFAGMPQTRPTCPAGLPLLALDRIWASPAAALSRIESHRTAMARRVFILAWDVHSRLELVREDPGDRGKIARRWAKRPPTPGPPGSSPCCRIRTVRSPAPFRPTMEHEEVREVERLYVDMIGEAERFIYAENQ